ncbi:unnamed protein product, partial [marine sediment metagenome]
MHDLDFITHLQLQNADAVPRFDPTVIAHHFILKRHFILQLTADGHCAGYVLHTAPRQGDPLRIDAFCIAERDRRQGLGKELFRKLRARAEDFQASKLTASCPANCVGLAFFL